MPPTHSFIDSMCEEIRYTSSAPEDTAAGHSPVQDFTSAELPVDLPLGPVVTPVRSLTLDNRSLRFLETGAPGSTLSHHMLRLAGGDMNHLVAVAYCDLHVARRNVADLMRYLDDQTAQLAVCVWALGRILFLMTV